MKYPIPKRYIEYITSSRFPKPYACYVRIPSIKFFLERIKPVLENRLMLSEFKEFNDKLRISCYKEGYELYFQKGKFSEIKKMEITQLKDMHVSVPPLVINQLLLGYRDLDELEKIYPDVSINPVYKQVIRILFPKIKASITPTL